MIHFSQIFPHFIDLIYTIHIISKTDAFLTKNKQIMCTSVLAPAALQALQSAGAKPENWPSAIKMIHFSQIFPHFVGLNYTIHIISKTDAFLTKNKQILCTSVLAPATLSPSLSHPLYSHPNASHTRNRAEIGRKMAAFLSV
jgi:hypothetical protein